MIGKFVTVTGCVVRIQNFPHNTSHVDIATADGIVIAQLEHATAEGLILGTTVRMRGVLTVERGVRFLIDVVEIETSA